MNLRKRTQRQVACFIALLLCGNAPLAGAAEQGDFPGVQQLMSAEEYRAAGLEKLTAEEREALNAWLLRYTATDAELLQQTSEEVRKTQTKEKFEVISRIVGDFDGWSGETVFRLENGQVWEQRLDGRYRYKGPPNPEVKIDRNFLGYFRLTVLETGRRVGVSPR